MQTVSIISFLSWQLLSESRCWSLEVQRGKTIKGFWAGPAIWLSECSTTWPALFVHPCMSSGMANKCRVMLDRHSVITHCCRIGGFGAWRTRQSRVPIPKQDVEYCLVDEC
ncbi:hypothetical protein BDP55DRAFT_298270 [Colletotrichum godetiae]|uniref:Secreted protein n=1 Tax=Colletotrichum godetiae TaxID=1209918 RepID=A0AAJ0ERC1_9PEZI|nr:uncharacterized protein BDP55DRAFT_298270 [Colletotrichum godetiae]KAK1671183.1 hypothetical protein BDP55DRAFT_298270 [Colletotrichum godetiae]